MFFFYIVCLFSIPICNSILIGTVNRARFTSIDQSNDDTVWLEQQFSPEKCLCTVLYQYKNVLLLNSYSNGSCQLFFSLPFAYKMESNTDSTIILLSSLPSVNLAPCCSNLSWLITRIQSSQKSSLNVNKPKYLVLDDNDYLAVISNADDLIRINRATFTRISSDSYDDPKALSYYDKKYYMSK